MAYLIDSPDSTRNTWLIMECKPILILSRSVDHQFPFTDYDWEIGRSKGVASHSLTLRITHCLLGSSIDVNLCKDLLLDEQTVCKIDFLRFHLCLEDIVDLSQNGMIYDSLGETSKGLIDASLKATRASDYNHDGSRRTHALLGQAVLRNLTSRERRNMKMMRMLYSPKD